MKNPKRQGDIVTLTSNGKFKQFTQLMKKHLPAGVFDPEHKVKESIRLGDVAIYGKVELREEEWNKIKKRFPDGIIR